MEDIVRCPYCVSGNEFRPMVRRVDGTFICGDAAIQPASRTIITSAAAPDALS
jgi:hypothetical protein